MNIGHRCTVAHPGPALQSTHWPEFLGSLGRAQIAAFLARTADARATPIDAAWGRATGAGRQLLPQAGGHDGFYYARLIKHD